MITCAGLRDLRQGGRGLWLALVFMDGHRNPRLPLPYAGGTGPDRTLLQAIIPEQAKGCKTTDLASKVVTPDVLVQPHTASRGMTSYTPTKNVSLPFPRRSPTTFSRRSVQSAEAMKLSAFPCTTDKQVVFVKIF